MEVKGAPKYAPLQRTAAAPEGAVGAEVASNNIEMMSHKPPSVIGRAGEEPDLIYIQNNFTPIMLLGLY